MKKIKLTLDRIEGDYGILVTFDGDEIQIPTKYLPESKKGSVICFDIRSEEEAKKPNEEIAKSILNEILRS